MTLRLGIIVGHSHEYQGARSISGQISELLYNDELAKEIVKRLSRTVSIIPTLIYRKGTYSQLPRVVNATGVDIALSLHCNAFNNQASGSEVLYYGKSKNSEHLAKLMQKHLVEALHLPNRGIKPLIFRGRGLHLLKKTSMPCIIVEPFFIDNPNDLDHANNRRSDLIQSYVLAILDYYKHFEGNP